jgi:hypothetical protein
VVDDDIQLIPIIIGQTFSNRTNVTMVIRNNQIRLFEKSFQTLIRRLGDGTVLALYNQEAITELHTDASMHGIGGILLQYQKDGTLHPICYYSRQTIKAEQSYHSYELEKLAVVESMRRFRVYLLDTHFTVLLTVLQYFRL